MKRVTCPVCSATSAIHLWSHRNDRFLLRRNDTRQVRFVMCVDCGLAYANPQLEAGEVASLYTDSYRDIGVNADHLEYKEQQSRERIDWLLTDYNKHESRVLEIGCSEGVLLRQMRDDLKWSVVGIEPFEPYARFGIDEWKLPIKVGFFPSPEPLKKFDLVAFLHVIEHISNPPEFFRHVTQTLAPGGHVFFETPNLLEPKIGRISANLFAAPHLAIFSPISLRWMLDQCGFEIVKMQSDLNLRVLARWTGRTTSANSRPSPGGRLHAVRTTLQFRWAWLRENALLNRRRIQGTLAESLRQALGPTTYQLLHELVKGTKVPK